MTISPATIIGPVLFTFALASMPDKYKPAWIHRLTCWQVLIGLIATLVAFLIIMSPEFYALGLLGDSTFFDLLALAIGLQLQSYLSRIAVYVATAAAKIFRFLRRRLAIDSVILALAVTDVLSTITTALSRASRIFPT